MWGIIYIRLAKLFRFDFYSTYTWSKILTWTKFTWPKWLLGQYVYLALIVTRTRNPLV